MDYGGYLELKCFEPQKSKTLVWMVQLGFAVGYIWLLKLSFLMEHLPLIIGKVMEVFVGKNEMVYFRKAWSLKHAQSWNLLDKCGCVQTWFAFPLNLFSPYHQKGGTKRLRVVLAFSFSHFGKKGPLTLVVICLHVTLILFILTCKCVLVYLETCLKANGIITNKFKVLKHDYAKSGLGMSCLCIMVSQPLWTTAKWNWLMHFA